jgi:hypothetical protein
VAAVAVSVTMPRFMQACGASLARRNGAPLRDIVAPACITHGGAAIHAAPPISFLLLADLTADCVFLPIQFFLLNLGDVSAIPACHVALFLTNAAIGAVQTDGLRF